MRLSAFHHEACFLREREGFQQIGLAFTSTMQSRQVRALLSRILAHFRALARTQTSITRFALMRDGLNAIVKEINDAL